MRFKLGDTVYFWAGNYEGKKEFCPIPHEIIWIDNDGKMVVMCKWDGEQTKYYECWEPAPFCAKCEELDFFKSYKEFLEDQKK